MRASQISTVPCSVQRTFSPAIGRKGIDRKEREDCERGMFHRSHVKRDRNETKRNRWCEQSSSHLFSFLLRLFLVLRNVVRVSLCGGQRMAFPFPHQTHAQTLIPMACTVQISTRLVWGLGRMKTFLSMYRACVCGCGLVVHMYAMLHGTTHVGHPPCKPLRTPTPLLIPGQRMAAVVCIFSLFGCSG